MFFQNISYIAVAVAAVAVMGIGFMWYSPWLFGKKWMKEMKLDDSEIESRKKRNGARGMAATYSISLILALVSSLVLAALMNSLVVIGFWGIVLTGFFMWLGFSMPVAANYMLFGRDSLSLFAINSGYQLVSLVVTAIIVGIFG